MSFSPNYLVPTLGPPREDSPEQESALFHEHSVQTIHTQEGDKAIWAIASDFNNLETMRMLSVVCDAFKKLGRVELAEKLWAVAKQEDFGINPLAHQSEEAIARSRLEKSRLDQEQTGAMTR